MINCTAGQLLFCLDIQGSQTFNFACTNQYDLKITPHRNIFKDVESLIPFFNQLEGHFISLISGYTAILMLTLLPATRDR